MELKKLSESTKEYYETMHTLAQDSSNMPFDNSGVEHAVAVMSALFKNSKERVCIYASTFDGTISNYEEYFNEFVSALKRNVKIYILFDSNPYASGDPSSAVLKYIKNGNDIIKDRVFIKTANADFKDKVMGKTVNSEEIHFAFGDERMVRIENDNIGHKAPYCNFNDTAITNVLSKLFDEGFKNGQEINLSHK